MARSARTATFCGQHSPLTMAGRTGDGLRVLVMEKKTLPCRRHCSLKLKGEYLYPHPRIPKRE
eukprot:1362710-Amphidinium_carterae.1